MNLADTPRKRIAVFFLLLFLGLVAVAARMAYIQFVQGPKLTAKARTQLQEHKALQSPRGR